MKRGYRMKPENLRCWTIHIRHLCDAAVSRNWFKTVSNLYKNSYIYNFHFSFKVPLTIYYRTIEKAYIVKIKRVWLLSFTSFVMPVRTVITRNNGIDRRNCSNIVFGVVNYWNASVYTAQLLCLKLIGIFIVITWF